VSAEILNRNSARSSSNDDHSNKHTRIPVPAVDLVVRKSGKILLEQRGRPPFEGMHCLPGGHVEYNETVEKAALRELKEETSIDAKLIGILGVFSDPNRDPRGQRISTIFVADWLGGEPIGADDAKSAEWFDESDLRNPSFSMAFDHALILRDYFMWKDSQSETFWSSKKD
jgi:ADP-ribose pyrophosphatase YjhB (NUDIX family)